MRKYIVSTLLASALFAGPAALPSDANAAGNLDAALVTSVEISFNSTHAYFYVDRNSNGTPPACASLRNGFAFPINSDKGKAYLSLVTAALLSGKKVQASGTGACIPEVGNMEGLAWFQIQR